MNGVEVEIDWLLQVRELLYGIATTEDNELGQLAEILGSHIPNYLEETKDDEKAYVIQTTISANRESCRYTGNRS